MFGAFAPLPIRLTSVDSLRGWSASSQSRLCADIVSLWRSLPLAVITVQVNDTSVSLLSYNGRNGSGTTHAPTLTWTSDTQPCKIQWENSYENDLEEVLPWAIRHGLASIEYSGSKKSLAIRVIPSATNSVDVIVESAPTVPYRMTVVVYGNWGELRSIGDYGGDLEKTDNTTEALIPYAGQWYKEIQTSRGSAYSTIANTLVDHENVSISRFMGAVFSRTPEKYSTNATPARSTERLNYWVEVLGVPKKIDDAEWKLRQRCAAHYKSAIGPTLSHVTSVVSELLGDCFVDIHTYYGADLDNPPYPTLWPGDGTDGGLFSIGGPTWLSRRSHIRVEVIEPPGIARAEFLQLMNVQLYQLLDRILPAWVTWNWSVGTDGFRIGIDQIGIDGI